MDAKSIDIDSLDVLPNGNSNTQTTSQAPPKSNKLDYVKKKTIGSVDELDIEFDDEPTTIPSDQSSSVMNGSSCPQLKSATTNLPPETGSRQVVTNTPSEAAKHKSDGFSKKKKLVGSMEELDIEIGDEPNDKAPDTSCSAKTRSTFCKQSSSETYNQNKGHLRDGCLSRPMPNS